MRSLRPSNSRPHPARRQRRPDNAIALDVLEIAVAAAFGLPVAALQSRSRGRAEAAFARQCAMYLAHVVLCLNYGAVGRLFHRDRTTAAHACKQVEARRDDPGFDRKLQTLEELCDGLARQSMVGNSAVRS